VAIRTFQPGDEDSQVAIYNAVAAKLPGFKPATPDEVRRRQRSKSFDAHWRFFALHENQPVGYIVLNRNGRVSYPWCLPGHESWQCPLLEAVRTAARQANFKRLTVAYRGDWTEHKSFFLQRGFRQAHEMINFVVEVLDLPTAAVHVGLSQRRMNPEDIPALREMGGALFAGMSQDELKQRLFSNPWFPAESLFVLHGRSSETPVACAALICESGYADPRKVDSAMPCFRLGAFGNELQDTKRIRGMFSYLAGANQNPTLIGLDLLGHVARMIPDDLEALAAQIQSDRPERKLFEHYFRRQGSFPVFELELQ